MRKLNWFYLLFSLVIAFLLWIYIISELNPETEVTFRNLNIQIVNSDQLKGNGLVITSGANTTVAVKVKGQRDKIALVKAGKFTLTASVASITAPGTYNLNYNIAIDVPEVSVISESPSQVTITVDRIASKTLPIDLSVSGTLKDDFVLSSTSLSNDAVVITGAQTSIDLISAVSVSFDITDLNDSVSATLPFVFTDENGRTVDAADVSTDIQAVTLDVNVKQRKVVPVTVNLISSEFFSEDMVECAIEPKEIIIVGAPDIVSTYNALVLGTVNLKTFITNRMETTEFDIVLPNGMIAETTAEKATVTIKTPDYSRKTVTIPSSAFNSSSEYRYASSSAISVDIFGPSDVLDDLDARDFTVKISYVKESTKPARKTAYLDVSCLNKDVVIFGTYTVTVTSR